VLNRKILANEPFVKDGRLTMTMITSFGCAGSCAFCTTPAQLKVMKTGNVKAVRVRSMDNVIEECLNIVKQFDVRNIQFIDDDLMHSVGRAKDFLKSWSDCLSRDITFSCLMRSDSIVQLGRYGILKRLHKSGLRKISLGVETGYDRGRRMVSNKNGHIDPKYDVGNVSKAIIMCAKLGIETKGFFMVGLPGETREETNKTICFMYGLKKLGLDKVALFPVKIYPNTAMWDIAVSLGYTTDELGHYNAPCVTDLIKSGINPIAASRDGYTNNVQLSEISNDDLAMICQREMDKFNNN